MLNLQPSRIILPQYTIRQKQLMRTLGQYPVYDPPHKSEDRTLPIDLAQENFDYFMSVRKERVSNFLKWLKDHFDVAISTENANLDRLFDWCLKYTAVLLPLPKTLDSARVCFEYSEPWSGRYAGANVLFDLSATIGEAVLSQRPDVRWQLEWSLADFPTYKETFPRDVQLILLSNQRVENYRRRDRWSGFRRPVLASAHTPLYFIDVFGHAHTHHLMMAYSTDLRTAWRTFKTPKALRSQHANILRQSYNAALRECSFRQPTISSL